MAVSYPAISLANAHDLTLNFAKFKSIWIDNNEICPIFRKDIWIRAGSQIDVLLKNE